ncbi:MAG: helix-turn-helix domain-containing protein [Clostridium sp.]
MAIFSKKSSTNWEEKYKDLERNYDKIYEENRELKNKVKLLETRFKKTGYLEPKERKITNEQILYIKTLREKEGLSYSSIAKESGWSKATICRVLNGAYDIEER